MTSVTTSATAETVTGETLQLRSLDWGVGLVLPTDRAELPPLRGRKLSSKLVEMLVSPCFEL